MDAFFLLIGRFSLASMVFLSLLAGAVPAAADTRVALVIGNAAYEHTTPLRNARRDAESLSDRLTQLEFDVIEAFEADSRASERAIAKFLRKAAKADLALLYYAGHGIQILNRNYLLPVDFDPGSVADVKGLGIDLTNLINRIHKSGVPKTITIVDACRNNPLGRNKALDLINRAARFIDPAGASRNIKSVPRGLARLEGDNTPSNADTIYMFAAQPGAVALDGERLNSPFAEGLLAYLGKPGLDVTQTFLSVSKYVVETTGQQQKPEMRVSWSSPYYLAPETARKKRVSYFFFDGYETSGQPKKKYLTEEARILKFYDKVQFLPPTISLKGSLYYPPGNDTHKARAKEAGFDPVKLGLGDPYGFELLADLDADNVDEALRVLTTNTGEVYLSIDDAGVRRNFAKCQSDYFTWEKLDRLEIGIHDINADRRPDIWIASVSSDNSWGELCIVTYKGISEKKPSGASFGQSSAEFDDSIVEVLIKGTAGWGARLLPGNVIEVCGGSNCADQYKYRWTGSRFEIQDPEGMMSSYVSYEKANPEKFKD